MAAGRVVTALAIVLALAGQAEAEAETETDDEAEAEAAQTPDKTARTTGSCIDKEIADRLAVKRRRRGAVDRLFVKQARHEFMICLLYTSPSPRDS